MENDGKKSIDHWRCAAYETKVTLDLYYEHNLAHRISNKAMREKFVR